MEWSSWGVLIDVESRILWKFTVEPPLWMALKTSHLVIIRDKFLKYFTSYIYGFLIPFRFVQLNFKVASSLNKPWEHFLWEHNDSGRQLQLSCEPLSFQTSSAHLSSFVLHVPFLFVTLYSYIFSICAWRSESWSNLKKWWITGILDLYSYVFASSINLCLLSKSKS